MKCSITFNLTQSGILDLDGKLPILSKMFPDVKLEKKLWMWGGGESLVMYDVIKNVKLIQLKNQSCDIELSGNLYINSIMSYMMLRTSFDLPDSMMDDFQRSDFFFQSKVLFDNQELSCVSYVLPQVLFKIAQKEDIREHFDTSFEQELSIDEQQDLLFEKTAVKYFADSEDLWSGLSGSPGVIIYEGYEDGMNVDDWDKINSDDNEVYRHKQCHHKYLTNEKSCEELFEHVFTLNQRDRITNAIEGFCYHLLDQFNKKSTEIRKNVQDENRNQFYWKKLNKNIEILDLSFLEFHTIAMQELPDIGVPNHFKLLFDHDYVDKIKKDRKENIKSTLELLNEVKYCISNLASPGHLNNEQMLQKETEKVNERILLLSFLAMSIPMMSAILSRTYSLESKLLSAVILLSLPILYFSINKLQKGFLFRKNMKKDKARLHGVAKNTLDLMRKKRDMMDSLGSILTSDLVKDFQGMMDQSIQTQIKKVEKLKKGM